MRLPHGEPPVHPVARVLVAILAASVLSPLPLHRLGAQDSLQGRGGAPLEARIWFDRGVDPVFAPGDRASVYYRANAGSHLLVLHIDTDGVLRLVGSGGESGAAVGGRDYRLLFADPEGWEVEASPGVGYFFVLASREPLRLERVSGGPWSGAFEGVRIRTDPYVAVDEVRRALLAGVEEGYSIDFTTYHVGQSYSYPRFLCFQCHVEQPFEEWNPYHQTCMDVRVVIFNDPYYYPATRYRGDQVIYARPPDPGLPQYAFTRRIPGEPGTPIVQSRTGEGGVAPPSSRPGEPGARRVPVRRGDDAGSAGRSVAPSTLLPGSDGGPGGIPLIPGTGAGPNRPTLRRR